MRNSRLVEALSEYGSVFLSWIGSFGASVLVYVLLVLVGGGKTFGPTMLYYSIFVVPSIILLYPAFAYIRLRKYTAAAVSAIVGVTSAPVVIFGGAPLATRFLDGASDVVPVTPWFVALAWVVEIISRRDSARVSLLWPGMKWTLTMGLALVVSGVEFIFWTDSGPRNAVMIVYMLIMMLIVATVGFARYRRLPTAVTLAGAVLATNTVVALGGILLAALIANFSTMAASVLWKGSAMPTPSSGTRVSAHPIGIDDSHSSWRANATCGLETLPRG